MAGHILPNLAPSYLPALSILNSRLQPLQTTLLPLDTLDFQNSVPFTCSSKAPFNGGNPLPSSNTSSNTTPAM